MNKIKLFILRIYYFSMLNLMSHQKSINYLFPNKISILFLPDIILDIFLVINLYYYNFKSLKVQNFIFLTFDIFLRSFFSFNFLNENSNKIIFILYNSIGIDYL